MFPWDSGATVISLALKLFNSSRICILSTGVRLRKVAVLSGLRGYSDFLKVDTTWT